MLFGTTRFIPPHNPDTPPDSSDPAGMCPRCGRSSNFTFIGTESVTFLAGLFAMNRDGNHERLELERASVLECQGCHERTVVIEEQWLDDVRRRDGGNGGLINYRGVWWWPPPGVADLDDSIPHEIADAYREGIRAMWALAPHAAAVMFRRTLEGVVKVSGSRAAQKAAESNLASGLRVMADEGALDKSLAEWAEAIKVVGNFGAHFDVSGEAVSPAEAEELSRLLRELLRYLYEMPARLRRARGQAT